MTIAHSVFRYHSLGRDGEGDASEQRMRIQTHLWLFYSSVLVLILFTVWVAFQQKYNGAGLIQFGSLSKFGNCFPTCTTASYCKRVHFWCEWFQILLEGKHIWKLEISSLLSKLCFKVSSVRVKNKNKKLNLMPINVTNVSYVQHMFAAQ